VAECEGVVEVESEKINNAVEAPAAGVLRRRVAREGEVLPVGGLLGVLAGSAVPDAEVDRVVEEWGATFVPEAAEAEAPEPLLVEVGGRRLQYLRLGEGGAAPLVLLPGFGGDITTFVFNQQELGARRPVLALDLPGQGGSDKDVGAGDLPFLVATVTGFLDALGLDRVHLAGHSMGGLVAGALTLQHPPRVRSLTLIASAGLGEEINDEYLQGFMAADRRRDMQRVLGLLFSDPALVTRQLVEGVLRQKRLDGAEAALRTIADQLFPQGRQATVLDLGQVSAPMLGIWGADDKILPAAQARNLPPSARVELIDGAGHMPQMEAAGTVNRTIATHLATVDS
ncbi:MAG: acetoin dehydrogenase dihydrolipoyllysine-residue acetyltransferase subunit, partial [Candidatus Dormibacteraceae bacterium]